MPRCHGVLREPGTRAFYDASIPSLHASHVWGKRDKHASTQSRVFSLHSDEISNMLGSNLCLGEPVSQTTKHFEYPKLPFRTIGAYTHVFASLHGALCGYVNSQLHTHVP